MFTSFAELKRFFASEGATVTQTRHDWNRPGRPSKILGVPRTVEKVQTNAVRLEGGSWWYFPPSKDVRFTEDGFETCLRRDGSFSEVMAYTCTNAAAIGTGNSQAAA